MSNDEYNKFDRTMRELMKVSHDDLKAKLEAEKAAKAGKKKADKK